MAFTETSDGCIVQGFVLPTTLSTTCRYPFTANRSAADTLALPINVLVSVLCICDHLEIIQRSKRTCLPTQMRRDGVKYTNCRVLYEESRQRLLPVQPSCWQIEYALHLLGLLSGTIPQPLFQQITEQIRMFSLRYFLV